jgi:hypothetical protein
VEVEPFVETAPTPQPEDVAEDVASAAEKAYAIMDFDTTGDGKVDSLDTTGDCEIDFTIGRRLEEIHRIAGVSQGHMEDVDPYGLLRFAKDLGNYHSPYLHTSSSQSQGNRRRSRCLPQILVQMWGPRAQK